MRSSNWVVASVPSSRLSSFSQAARMNACSVRNPRSFAAVRSRLRNSSVGNARLRSILRFLMIDPPFFVWRICGASAQKPPQRNKLTRLADQIARTVATFLYVPIPTANNKSPPSACLCPILSPNCCYLSLTVAFCRQQFLSCPLVVLNLSATVPECPKLSFVVPRVQFLLPRAFHAPIHLHQQCWCQPQIASATPWRNSPPNRPARKPH